MSAPRVIIIGAGPAGLTLGRLLQCYSIPFTIFERDASPNTRQQGGSLDLHPLSGQLALSEAGLLDEFNKHARYQDQVSKVLDKTGNIWLQHEAAPDEIGRPEIDRLALRTILLESIKPENIEWGYTMSKVYQREDGTAAVHFSNHKEPEIADLVIGADGGWSKVRGLLTDARPLYTGLTMVDCRISDLDAKFPSLGEYLGRGTIFAFSGGHGLLAQRNGDGSIRVYPCLKVPEGWSSQPGLDWNDVPAIKEKLLSDFYADWSSELRDFVRHADTLVFPRPIYQLPPGSRWETRKVVTLLGDAAHLVSPFAGEGVNLAMLDALELAKSIKANLHDLETALREYERNIFDRAAAANKMASKSMELALRDDSPKAYVEEMGRIIVEFADGHIPE